MDVPQMISPERAAELLGENVERVRRLAELGVLISEGADEALLLELSSVERTIERRAERDRAKAAFTSNDPIERLAYLSGMSRAQIEAFGGA